MWWFVGLLLVLGLGVAGVLVSRNGALGNTTEADRIARDIEIIEM